MATAQEFPASALLAWYERSARDLPWRIAPGAGARGRKPDPYRVWLSEIMLQQTTVAAVAPRFARFLERWPTVAALAAAPIEDVLGEWAGLGYYARARNLHKAAIAVAKAHGGVFPDTEEGLRALPGIGAYTAAAVAAIAFGKRAVVVDGNVERVMARWFAIEAPFPSGKIAARAGAEAVWPRARSGDFAQALMDLGAGVCTPRAPSCLVCPIATGCAARASGAADSYPRRALKKVRPLRKGAVFALFDREGRVLVERRPDKGLLGGTTGLPGSPWAEDAPPDAASAPVAARWSKAGAVAHVFTHFRLELDVYTADASRKPTLTDGLSWADAQAVRMPTVMRKALNQAMRRKTTEPAE